MQIATLLKIYEYLLKTLNIFRYLEKKIKAPPNYSGRAPHSHWTPAHFKKLFTSQGV